MFKLKGEGVAVCASDDISASKSDTGLSAKWFVRGIMRRFRFSRANLGVTIKRC